MASNGTFKIIGDHLRKDPTLFYTDPMQVIPIVLNRNAVSLQVKKEIN